MVVPPDITRLHSYAGELTRYAWQYYGDHLTDIMPALGTHVPMSVDEIKKMYGDTPVDLFREHDWRTECPPASPEGGADGGQAFAAPQDDMFGANLFAPSGSISSLTYHCTFAI